MNEKNKIYRYEIKFKHDFNIEQLITILKLNKNYIYKTYPDRIVNSLYMDTYLFDSYYDNVNGNCERQKYRIRWYKDTDQKINNPKLEIKKRKGSIGTKLTYGINDFSFNDLSNKKELIGQFVNSKIPEYFLMKIKDLIPVSIVSYERSYYQAKEKPIRITIDRDVNYFDAYNKNLINMKRPIKKKDSIIVEFKFPINLYKEASDLINYIGLRRTKSSKYIDSVETLEIAI